MQIDNMVIATARQCLTHICNHERYTHIGLAGMCEPACDLLIRELNKNSIKASKHHGWCLYDSCDGVSGEPCAPHFYVLVHKGRERWYLDITATQFQIFLERAVTPIIYQKEKPYWFRPQKPSLREMEYHAGY